VIYRGPFIPTANTDTTQGVNTPGTANTPGTVDTSNTDATANLPTLDTSPVISQPSADQRITTDGLWLRFERPLPVGGWCVSSVAKSVEGLVAKEFPDGRSSAKALRQIRSSMMASRC